MRKAPCIQLPRMHGAFPEEINRQSQRKGMGMNPVQINFNVDELTRMTMQVREHNHSDDQNNVTLCLCRECDVVRAFKATTPILNQLQRAKAATEARNQVGELLRSLLAGLAVELGDETDEDDETAEDAPRDTYAGIDTPAPADDTYQRDAEGYTADEVAEGKAEELRQIGEDDSLQTYCGLCGMVH